MFRRNNKTRKYHAPTAQETQMELESNFCNSVLFNIQVEEYEVANDEDTDEVFSF